MASGPRVWIMVHDDHDGRVTGGNHHRVGNVGGLKYAFCNMLGLGLW